MKKRIASYDADAGSCVINGIGFNNGFGTLNAPLSFCKLQDDYSDKILGLGIYPYAEGFDDYIEALNYKGK